MDPKRLVRAGYERIAEQYDGWSARVDAAPRERYVSLLTELLDPGATVLELGCGTGLATRELTQRFDVYGVDFSHACLDVARRRAPAASYMVGDVTRLGIRPRSMAAVAAFYSLIHVPRTEQPGVVQDASRWLRPGGLFLATFGTGDLADGTDPNWLGVPMYWSSHAPDTTIGLIQAAGFDILQASEVPQEEDGKIFSFLWVVARLGVAGS